MRHLEPDYYDTRPDIDPDENSYIPNVPGDHPIEISNPWGDALKAREGKRRDLDKKARREGRNAKYSAGAW